MAARSQQIANRSSRGEFVTPTHGQSADWSETHPHSSRRRGTCDRVPNMSDEPLLESIERRLGRGDEGAQRTSRQRHHAQRRARRALKTAPRLRQGHYERVSFLTLFVTAAVPNHTGGTPIWFNILGAIFIVIVMAVVVLRQRRK